MTVLDQLTAAVGGDRGSKAADRLCEACVELFDVEGAALSLVVDGAPTGTLGASGSKARLYDELQFTYGEGPCLDTVSLKAPVMVIDLADPAEVRWPAYRPAMLAHRIRTVYAMPVIVGGEYSGALDLFQTRPGGLSTEHLAGAFIAADLAGIPVLDLLGEDLQAAAADPESDAWTELTALSRAEVSQATGMLIAQLNIGPAEALVRLRAHAYTTGNTATDVAREILAHRLRLTDG
jgi:ANTAR domain/GAF domain